MASFDVAIPILLRAEGDGKVTNDPDDPGGLTRWGITKRFNPTLDIVNLSRNDAIKYYKDKWWTPNSAYQRITSQAVATKLLLLAVNKGPDDAARCLQVAIRSVAGRLINIDGVAGSNTVTLANACDERLLLAAFVSASAMLYLLTSKPKFVNGLLNRAYAKDDF